jgi:hypothetical protein
MENQQLQVASIKELLLLMLNTGGLVTTYGAASLLAKH